MNLCRRRPFNRILVLLLSWSVVVPPSYGQIYGGYGSDASDVSTGSSAAAASNFGSLSNGMSLQLGQQGGVPTIQQSDGSDLRARGQNQGAQVAATGAGLVPQRPLPPNDFQRFVLESTGQALPLFGARYFSQGADAYPAQGNTPVSPDYRIGPGDELQIRGWGSVEIDVKAVVDRDGLIHIPRIGKVNLSGIRSSQAEDVIRAAVQKYYKDFQLSVTMGQLRGITVYVVGQARKPGAYQLPSTSTLVSALFASGGPNQTGSMRQVQVKRNDQVVTQLDLYAFLARGDKSADVRLQDGDTIVIPPAQGYVALSGKVATPAVYELGAQDTIGSILGLAGGLPVVADPKRAQLERIDPAHKPARSVEVFALDAAGLSKPVRSGDILSVSSLVPEFGNAVALRGNVAQPLRSPWHDGMRITDLIPSKGFLMSRASIKRQNEALLSDAAQQRAMRGFGAARAMGSDGGGDGGGMPMPDRTSGVQGVASLGAALSGATLASNNLTVQGDADTTSDMAAAGDTADTLASRIGNLVDEVNFAYAVVERVDRKNVSVKLLPFDLGHALDDPSSPDNLLLQPGDIVTVFSVNDVRVPQAKRQVFVRVEGEVQRPGIYQMAPGDSLQQLIEKAGGLTPDAYLFGAGFYREEVKRAQTANLDQLVRRLEAQVDTRLSTAAASVSSNDATAAQIRMQAEANAQKQALARLRNFKPTGRVMLELGDRVDASPAKLPALRLENQDRLVVPPRPDFVYVLGSVNTETSFIWRAGESVQHYLDESGLTSGADVDEMFVLRADGRVLSNNSSGWFNNVSHAEVLPGDVIVLPEKTDHESAWSVFTRNAKDITQIFYQLGLGAAAIKTLRE
jgi:protein involved in polysaccharide export with SLBB domain